jgi:hypothetical protein
MRDGRLRRYGAGDRPINYLARCGSLAVEFLDIFEMKSI